MECDNQESYSDSPSRKLRLVQDEHYDDVTIGELKDSLSLEGLSYSRSTVTEDLGSYKNVVVTVNWGPEGMEHNVSLVTLIAPK